MKYIEMKPFLFLSFFIFLASQVPAQVVALNDQEILALKKLVQDNSQARQLYSDLKKTADAALQAAPSPVDTVVSEGHLATDPKKIITTAALKDIDKIYALAFAYRLEGQAAYLKKSLGFMNAWALANQPQGNPINDSKFEHFFMAYDLLRQQADATQRKTIEDWLRRMADAEIATAAAKNKKTSYNNWNSHRLKVVGCIAYLLGDARYQAYIREQLPVQIGRNLLPDGSGIDFIERDALHYHIYTLEPLISLATVLKRATGADFYHYVSPGGASIKKSIDFLVPFATGEKTHAEFLNSKSAFDKMRADNKEAGYETGAAFQPRTAVGVLVEAAYFEPSCLDVAKKLAGRDSFPDWLAVINQVREQARNH